MKNNFLNIYREKKLQYTKNVCNLQFCIYVIEIIDAYTDDLISLNEIMYESVIQFFIKNL